jgi:C-terminal processing protease CtpA/Prc
VNASRCACAIALLATSSLVSPTRGTDSPYLRDFDLAWQRLREDYGYFDKGSVDWAQAREVFRPKAAQARTLGEFVGVMEALVDQLCDFHSHLNTNTSSSQRLAPSGAHVWAELENGRAIITDVRTPETALRLGIHAGDEVKGINGTPVLTAIAKRIGPAAHAEKHAVKEYALMCLLTGTHDHDVTVRVKGRTGTRTILLSSADKLGQASRTRPAIAFKKLAHNIGYIRLNDSIGDTATIREFDGALSALKATGGLILDLRDTPSGGNTTVARGIMGRLIAKERPYQKHADAGEQRETGIRHAWIELVSPRGPFTYSRPVVVLVGRWTASMGEGTAIGLSGMGRAKVVGTRMAGLLGAKRAVDLPNAHFAVTYAAERLFTVGGVPRESFVPDVLVDLAKAKGADPVLSAGVAALRRSAATSP